MSMKMETNKETAKQTNIVSLFLVFMFIESKGLMELKFSRLKLLKKITGQICFVNEFFYYF